MDKLADLMLLVLRIVETGVAVLPRLQELQRDVARMVAENRDPSPAEWAALEARIMTAHAGIQAEAERRRQRRISD